MMRALFGALNSTVEVENCHCYSLYPVNSSHGSPCASVKSWIGDVLKRGIAARASSNTLIDVLEYLGLLLIYYYEVVIHLQAIFFGGQVGCVDRLSYFDNYAYALLLPKGNARHGVEQVKQQQQMLLGPHNPVL
uniref:Uncharacterized protein n=1 Tax=Ditylenchus dipsaci TaxID=166011 RepID=A0A915ETX0_9BILA